MQFVLAHFFCCESGCFMHGLDEIFVREVAFAACVDPRTVRNFLSGKPVRGIVGARIARVVARLEADRQPAESEMLSEPKRLAAKAKID